MDLTYTSEHQLLRESAERFLAETYSFEKRQAIVATPSGLDEEVWSSFAELGWLGLPFSEESGGFDGGPVETAILMEALGRGLVVEPWFATVVLAGGLVERLGAADQRQALLGPLIAGESRLALAHIEREAGETLSHVATRATRSGEGYRIEGAKTAALGAPGAGVILVSARLSGDVADKKGIAVFAVPADAPGLAIAPYQTVDGGRAADLTIATTVGAETMLGGSDDVFATLEAVHDQAVAALCSDAVGAMDALLAATVAYTGERVQFGKPLSSFQSIRHRLAEMAVRCEEARAIALLATLSVDSARTDRIRGVSGAKAKIGRASRHVAQEAIQLHGAMGFSEEMPIGSWFKRLYAFENMLGSTAYHLRRYGSVILHPEAASEGLLRAPATAE